MAPHSIADVINSNWDRPYPRELGAFPAVSFRKFQFHEQQVLIFIIEYFNSFLCATSAYILNSML